MAQCSHLPQCCLERAAEDKWRVVRDAENASLHFAHLLEGLVAALHGIQRVLARLVLEDIPLGLAFALAKREDRLPVNLVLADDRVRSAAKSFDMDAPRAAGILLQYRHWVSATFAAIAGVELHDYFRLGVAKEQIPGGNTFDFFEVRSEERSCRE